MKCTNCGKNTAIYHYVTDLNGQVNEVHLCEECARKAREENGESAWETMNKEFRKNVSEMFGEDSWMNSFLSDDFGRGQRSLFDRFFDDDFMSMPRFGTMMLPGFFIPAPRRADRDQELEERTASPKEKLGDEIREKKKEIDEAIARKREILALKEEMHRAARNEEYEKAARLRDQLKALENRDQA